MSKVKNGYEIHQNNKDYILLIDLQDNHLIFKCLNKFSGNIFFSKLYKIENLHTMSKNFRYFDNIKDMQIFLNNAIEKGKFGLLEDLDELTIFFYLISNSEENIIAFTLLKQKNIKKKFKEKELNSIIENKDIEQNTLKLTEQINKLNKEIVELKKEMESLKEENNSLNKENNEFKEYKEKYELLIKLQEEKKNEFKDKFQIYHEEIIIICDKKIKNYIENNKEIGVELNNEDENNMNIIYNDNYENESENEKEANVI